jgi:hypothetical protein
MPTTSNICPLVTPDKSNVEKVIDTFLLSQANNVITLLGYETSLTVPRRVTDFPLKDCNFSEFTRVDGPEDSLDDMFSKKY